MQHNFFPDNAELKAAFLERVTHDVEGAFSDVKTVCLAIKIAVENKKDLNQLLDPMIDSLIGYQLQLRNFLEYSRFEFGLSVALLEEIDVPNILKNVISDYEKRAKEKKVKLRLSVVEGFPELLTTDEYKVVHIVSNLITNAIEYSEIGGIVHLELLWEPAKYWSISIHNDGEVIANKQLENIFNASFEYGRDLKNPGGLGLIVTKYLAEHILNGHFQVVSDAQAVSACRVTLPILSK